MHCESLSLRRCYQGRFASERIKFAYPNNQTASGKSHLPEAVNADGINYARIFISPKANRFLSQRPRKKLLVRSLFLPPEAARL